jgi:protein-tyrosine phosphatase
MEILSGIDAGLPLTFAMHGRHVLLDTPRASLPLNLSELLFELQTRKITPILAHPERTVVFQKDPEKLLDFLDRGAVCQVNVGSLKGAYGPAARDTALLILENQWAHFLASDAHRRGRSPLLQGGMLRLANLVPPAYLQLITQESGEALQEGRTLPNIVRNPRPKQHTGGLRAGIARLFGRRA